MYKICHTEQSSKRQRLLERGLLMAMTMHPYEKITLSDLCTQLQIPRKSFYRYFPTKEDCLLALIDHTLSDCNAIVLAGWEGEEELKMAHLQNFFTYWQSQKVFLDVIRNNDLSHLLLDRTSVIVDRMKEKGENESFARNQVEYFVAQGLMAAVLRWHRFGFAGTVDEMARVFSDVLHTPDVSITRLML